MDMVECLSAELKKADVELNRTYQETLKKLAASGSARLQKAQRAWIAYRDAHCETEFGLWDGGSGGPVALAQCRLNLTERRTKEIVDTYSTSNR